MKPRVLNRSIPVFISAMVLFSPINAMAQDDGDAPVLEAAPDAPDTAPPAEVAGDDMFSEANAAANAAAETPDAAAHAPVKKAHKTPVAHKPRKAHVAHKKSRRASSANSAASAPSSAGANSAGNSAGPGGANTAAGSSSSAGSTSAATSSAGGPSSAGSNSGVNSSAGGHNSAGATGGNSAAGAGGSAGANGGANSAAGSSSAAGANTAAGAAGANMASGAAGANTAAGAAGAQPNGDPQTIEVPAANAASEKPSSHLGLLIAALIAAVLAGIGFYMRKKSQHTSYDDGSSDDDLDMKAYTATAKSVKMTSAKRETKPKMLPVVSKEDSFLSSF